MLDYMQPIPDYAVNMLHKKSDVIFEKIKNMKQGDGVWIRKEDLSSFYSVANKHGMKFRRRSHDGGYLMGMVYNGYAAKMNVEEN
jgi:hypothetical protein